MSKVHARSQEITNKPLWVRTTKTLWLLPQMLKKWRIVINRISKARQITCSWIKKILDEATRIVNVFLISWFFYFLLCSISLLVKYDFILRYGALVNAIRASSFIENFPQISAKPIAFQRNLLGKFSRNRPFYTNRFSAKLASKIPAKFPRNSREIGRFFHEFVPENPAVCSRYLLSCRILDCASLFIYVHEHDRLYFPMLTEETAVFDWLHLLT